MPTENIVMAANCLAEVPVARAGLPLRRTTLHGATLLLATALALTACDQSKNLLSAKQATTRSQLVGGPVAYADVGDFVLENDKVRVAILGSERSWGPGIFGGSLVDADIRRNDPRYPSGQGRDKFAEIFPFANLLVPAPKVGQVTVVKDGSDGVEAIVRVEGKGEFLFTGIDILDRDRDLLSGLYPDLKTAVSFRTDYSLAPGQSYVKMKTWVILGDRASNDAAAKPGDPCKTDAACKEGALVCVGASGTTSGTCGCKSLKDQGCGDEVCDIHHVVDKAGCPVCGCSNVADMNLTTGTESVFGVILGDSAASPTKVSRAGVGAGDFVFFGNQTDIFVPGHGYDEEKPVWDALFTGRDTFAKPLAFDFVGSAGGEVSYGYFSKKTADSNPDPHVLVPVFTSAATAFITATLGCKWDGTDADTCGKSRVYEFERYLAIGSGDIGSVYDSVVQVRATDHGTLQGVVTWQSTGGVAPNSTVFVLRNPDVTKAWTSADDVIAANRLVDNSPGVVNAIDADVGLDPIEDGEFQGSLPPGDYVLVAMDSAKVVVGAPVAIHIEAGKTVVANPSLPTPARIRLHAVDASGASLPAKCTVVLVDAQGQPVWRDGGRRTYFGQGRLGGGVQVLNQSMTGQFDIAVPAGNYQVVVSHGPEWGRFAKNYAVQAGGNVDERAVLARQIDSTGWVSGDFHLHAEPSFDSGMPLGQRVQSIVAEGVDYVASTDHDVISDYTPFIRQLGLDQWLKAVVGAEVTTLEIGHYIGFPLQYHQSDLPSHGSVDWYCKPSNDVVQEIIKRSGFESLIDKPTTIIAHPRDGFLGWLSQAGVNPYSLTRKLSSLEEANPVLRTVACDFDAFELFNGKRFDMLHTATIREIQTYSRCLYRIDHSADNKADDATARSNLDAACPELQPRGLAKLATCPIGEDFLTCQHRYRVSLARILSADILVRTPQEAQTWMQEPTSTDPGAAESAMGKLDASGLCKFDPSKLNTPLEQVVAAADMDRPCTDRKGIIEDEFRFLEHGFVHTALGGSDSHGASIEPGTPRTFIRSSTDEPAHVDPAELARNLRAGQAVASYGPMLTVLVAGKGPGETVSGKKGSPLAVHVRVQTPDWFGIDRVEIYVNGLLAASEDLTVPASQIVDVDKDYSVDIPADTATRKGDSWILVKVLGVQEEHLMRPVYLDVPFGELQLPKVASMAFSHLPLINTIFPAPAQYPDFYPVYPLAMANPILVDTDGNGRYDAPLPSPAFCSPPCDPATGKLLGSEQTCADVQNNYQCLTPENRCGLNVPGLCDVYQTQKAGQLNSFWSAHTP